MNKAATFLRGLMLGDSALRLLGAGVVSQAGAALLEVLGSYGLSNKGSALALAGRAARTGAGAALAVDGSRQAR